MSRPAPAGAWQIRALVWSAGLCALGYLGFALWGGWREVGQAIRQVGAPGIGLALALALLNYGLRFVRWQLYLARLGHPGPWRPSLRIYLAGFALTTTPGKVGEALRGVLLQRWGVPYPHSFAAFFSERLSDLVAIVLLALLGLSTHASARPLVISGLVLSLLGLAVLANGRWTQALLDRVHETGSRARRGLRHLLTVLVEARHCHAPGVLAQASLLALVAWSAEAWAFHLILHRMGADTPLVFAVFVYAVSMLAGALSFTPGGLGSAEAVMVGLLVWQGVDASDAVAATLVIRLATLWFAVGLGAGALGSAQLPRLPPASKAA